MPVRLAALAFLALTGADRASTTSVGALGGNWGGDRVKLVVTPTSARMALDCGAGAFPTPITLDRHGNFIAQGTLQFYRPGPTGADALEGPAAVTYKGHVAGDQLILEVSGNSLAAASRYVLTHNYRVKLIRCL